MRDLFLAIFNIFRFIGRLLTGFRNLVFNILFLVVLILIGISFIPEEVETLPQNSILLLKIEGKIVEQKKEVTPLSKYLENEFYSDSPAKETALQDILDAINSAAEDTNISGILLDLKYMSGAGLNQLQVIGKTLEKFKAAGKPVVASQDFYSQAQYYLASFADTVIITPLGGVDLHGFGVYRLYFRDAMDKLGVNYNIFKVGNYKSALEPFTRNDMSNEDRQQNREWLEALWTLFVSDIATNRKIPEQNLKDYTFKTPAELRRVAGDTAKLALETGLIDKIWTRNQIYSYLKDLSGAIGKDPHFVPTGKYLANKPASYTNKEQGKSVVGIIIAEGNILPGKQPPGQIGGETLSALIRGARKDDQVKALVLRINTGGGSAVASEAIRQELLEVQNAGKPVVVSMGALAASGGYWISASADEIWASESTITGSIGIFGAIPTFEETLAKIGVYSDGIGTTPLASGLNVAQPLAKELQDIFQQSVDNNYERFLELVAKGRDISISEVRELAGGRVYDGATAENLGLVDKLGTLEEAIDSAALLAKLTDYSSQYIEPPTTFRDQVFKMFATDAKMLADQYSKQTSLYNNLPTGLSENLETLWMLKDPKGLYAHWLNDYRM